MEDFTLINIRNPENIYSISAPAITYRERSNMKVLITAGGTTEPIDRVRSISNTSTGKLGSLIAEAFDQETVVKQIYYICGKNSFLPKSTKSNVSYIDTVASLEETVKRILTTESIDVIIHCMAVSDYRVSAVTSLSTFAENLKFEANELPKDDQKLSEALQLALVQASEASPYHNGKIPSNIDHLLLCMERTPKIISLFQKLAPEALLVGFKLLDHASKDELLAAAFQVLQDNQCCYVLANDLRDITTEQHIGYLLDQKKNYTQYTTKAEIANAIVSATIKKE